MIKTPGKVRMSRNILSVWNMATEEELAEGIEWYQAAHTFAKGLSKRYSVTLEQAAGVIAALSPQLHWSRNMAYADLFCRTGDAPTLNLSRSKARRILAGESTDIVFAAPKSNPRSGMKVRAFYACILDPNCDDVCVDRHAFDIAYGAVTDDRTRKVLDRVGVYDSVRDAYRTVAEQVDVSPSTVQATCWVVWRNNFSLKTT